MELLETGHGFEEEDDESSAFNGFDGPAEEVGSEGFEVLEDEHLVGLSEDFMGLFVVGVAYFGAGDE